MPSSPKEIYQPKTTQKIFERYLASLNLSEQTLTPQNLKTIFLIILQDYLYGRIGFEDFIFIVRKLYFSAKKTDLYESEPQLSKTIKEVVNITFYEFYDRGKVLQLNKLLLEYFEESKNS